MFCEIILIRVDSPDGREKKKGERKRRNERRLAVPSKLIGVR